MELTGSLANLLVEESWYYR